jgi:hypothetical protein
VNIGGAEFRIAGLPPGWSRQVVPAPGASATLSLVAHVNQADANASPNVKETIGDGRVCVPGGTLTVNGSGCTVGTVPAPWSTIKSPYE